ncbi:hypothetical protein HDF16_005334 [Granulicella aggregans]|uniref:Uncharacterized protein n=1 Tax=Granulicella aggregans TaxID=474949 RepID=A0A7W7ZIX6_9BACT|nr:hypothetical protein [Granulicella aggregans]
MEKTQNRSRDKQLQKLPNESKNKKKASLTSRKTAGQSRKCPTTHLEPKLHPGAPRMAIPCAQRAILG